MYCPPRAILTGSLLWSIKADSHHKVVLLEELAPLGFQKGSVRLQKICDGLRTDKRLLQFNYFLEKIYTQRSWFSALPHKFNDGCWLGCDGIRDKYGQHLIGHPILFACAEQCLLLQIKAVFAVKIRRRPYRFSQPRGCPDLQRPHFSSLLCSPSIVDHSGFSNQLSVSNFYRSLDH